MADESHWIERAQAAETRSKTYGDQIERLKEKVRDTREALCAKELSNGSIQIDFEKLAEKLGIEACLELRAIIDARYSISGEPGQKPKVRLKANAAAPEGSGDQL